MIFDMSNRLGAGAVAFTLAVLIGCQANAEATSAAADISLDEVEPATLGSMDEQYAWVGDSAEDLQLHLYTDADFAGCPKTLRSTTGAHFNI